MQEPVPVYTFNKHDEVQIQVPTTSLFVRIWIETEATRNNDELSNNPFYQP